MSATSTSIIKRLFVRAFFGAFVFIAPAFAIKWGQLHPHINWPQFLQSAWAVGLAQSPLGHQAFYSARFHWQELTCLLIFWLVSLQAEYLLAAYGGEDSEKFVWPRTKSQWRTYVGDQERLLRAGTTVSMFLFVAACALCERIQLGTISSAANYDSMIRDAGIVIETYFLFKTMTVVSESVTFNGMVVRTDIERAYYYAIASLVGLSLSFAAWFPLLAIPGGRIATQWIFARLRESLKDPTDINEAESDAPAAGGEAKAS